MTGNWVGQWTIQFSLGVMYSILTIFCQGDSYVGVHRLYALLTFCRLTMKCIPVHSQADPGYEGLILGRDFHNYLLKTLDWLSSGLKKLLIMDSLLYPIQCLLSNSPPFPLVGQWWNHSIRRWGLWCRWQSQWSKRNLTKNPNLSRINNNRLSCTNHKFSAIKFP